MFRHLRILLLVHLASFAALFSVDASATVYDFYFATGAQATAKCTASFGSCTGWNNSVSWAVYANSGADRYNYWYSNGTYNACAGKPYTKPSGQCSASPYSPTECSNGGWYSDAGNCVSTPPDCGDLGQVWNGTACAWPESPTCGAGEIATVNSSGATIACTPTTDLGESCDYSLGYDASGYFICSDEAAGCEAKGGTAGFVDGTAVCIPSGYSPPTCSSTQAVVLDAGGFVCSTPSDVKPVADGSVTNPSANPAPPAESSTNTSGQSAAPGTGTAGGGSGGTGTPEAPATEAHQGTPEAGKTGQARASGNCAAPPICSGGDPQMCALIRQQWEAMCKGNDLVEEADDNQRGVLEGKFADGVTGFGSSTVFEGMLDDGLGAVKVGPVYGATVGTFEGFIAGLLPNGGSCADLSFSYLSHTITISCSGTAIIRALLGWVFYVLTAWHIFGIVMRPAEG